MKKTRSSEVITTIHGNILENLARFKYLTPKQCMRIGIGTTQITYLRKNLRYLKDRKKPYVGCHVFNFPDPKRGRVESLYFLKPRGKEACIQELMITEETIRMPIGNSMAFKDYFHRVATIWFHITLWEWASRNQRTIKLFDTYFDKIGNNRIAGNLRAKNKITLDDGSSLIPDASFIIESHKGKQELFLFEMHRGHDAGRMIGQIYEHCKAQFLGSPQAMYSLEQPYLVVLVFEFESCLQGVLRAIPQHPRLAHMTEYFLCKSQDQLLLEPFDQGWRTLSGKVVGLMD